MMWKKTW